MMLNASLCDWSDPCIPVKKIIKVVGQGADTGAIEKTNKRYLKTVPFTDCISKINNAQVNNAKDLDVLMLMNNLVMYRDNYAEASGSL